MKSVELIIINTIEALNSVCIYIIHLESGNNLS